MEEKRPEPSHGDGMTVGARSRAPARHLCSPPRPLVCVDHSSTSLIGRSIGTTTVNPRYWSWR